MGIRNVKVGLIKYGFRNVKVGLTKYGLSEYESRTY